MRAGKYRLARGLCWYLFANSQPFTRTQRDADNLANEYICACANSDDRARAYTYYRAKPNSDNDSRCFDPDRLDYETRRTRQCSRKPYRQTCPAAQTGVGVERGKRQTGRGRGRKSYCLSLDQPRQVLHSGCPDWRKKDLPTHLAGCQE